MNDRDETGWLIESDSPQGVPQYWDGRKTNSFTTDSYEAVRFARFEDAERVRAWILLEPIREHCRSVEHAWTLKRAEGEGGDAVIVYQAADFEQSLRAFDLFSTAEKRQALERYGQLHYDRVEDRFFEAVYSVIKKMPRREGEGGQ